MLPFTLWNLAEAIEQVKCKHQKFNKLADFNMLQDGNTSWILIQFD